MSIKTETYLGIPFANNAGSTGRFEITNTNETDYPQKATFEEGFPAVTRISTSAGGKNPFGQDFNGMFFLTTSAIRELQAGKTLTYNEDFANAIGGYTVGAKVTGSDGLIYICTTDGNTSDPTGLDGWQTFLSSATDSESETQAATSLAVKKAYDKSNNALPITGGTVTGLTNFTNGLQSNGNNVLTENDKSNLQGIGYNQSWQNVTSSRSNDIEYQNNTGKPIAISIAQYAKPENVINVRILVNNVTVTHMDPSVGGMTSFAIIPNGATYKVSGWTNYPTNSAWSELR